LSRQIEFMMALDFAERLIEHIVGTGCEQQARDQPESDILFVYGYCLCASKM